MTLFWKHVSFGGVCFISFAYSAPLLATAGIFSIDVAYMNYNLTLKVCKFSDKQSVLKIIYPYLLFLIMTANLVITIYMYLPVLKFYSVPEQSTIVKLFMRQKHTIHLVNLKLMMRNQPNPLSWRNNNNRNKLS